MQINFSKKGEQAIVEIVDRLDTTTAPECEREVMSYIDKGELNMVLDMEKLNYISSAGLRVVLLLAKRLKKEGGKLVICGLTGMVKEVFEMSGFDSFFEIYPTTNDLPC